MLASIFPAVETAGLNCGSLNWHRGVLAAYTTPPTALNTIAKALAACVTCHVQPEMLTSHIYCPTPRCQHKHKKQHLKSLEFIYKQLQWRCNGKLNRSIHLSVKYISTQTCLFLRRCSVKLKVQFSWRKSKYEFKNLFSPVMTSLRLFKRSSISGSLLFFSALLITQQWDHMLIVLMYASVWAVCLEGTAIVRCFNDDLWV